MAWRVIERARKVLYAKRTEANRLVKERQAAADQAAAKAGAVRDALSAYRMQHGLSAETVDLTKAQGDLDAARAAEMLLVQQRQAAERSALAQTKTRERSRCSSRRRRMRGRISPIPPTDEDFAKAAKGCSTGTSNDFAKADSEVRRLEHELRKCDGRAQVRRRHGHGREGHEQTLRDGVVRAAKAVDDIADLEAKPKNSSKPSERFPSPQATRNSSRPNGARSKPPALVEYAKKASDVATWRSRDQG